MQKIFLACLLLAGDYAMAQTVCDPGGNVVLFSNYDGGVLNINCDVNIPNLKIGVVSYEMVTINLTGPFVNNVTAVRFAGYTTTTHQLAAIHHLLHRLQERRPVQIQLSLCLYRLYPIQTDIVLSSAIPHATPPQTRVAAIPPTR